ncbi:glycosyltransferase [Cytophagaceae bacterium DM2B3-1]|uniref:Glycosyltransferase n=1 Tax=Xanthocytophaga flava TaxID=3048013 RepID=A0ABT7CDC9_9BACT|nr:glycosyltransferase [Xanthocytophaga flavus]MDJ1471640.1 glycosyltransferase [Xanthocytophaga flavus]MDJ1491713.1 glycosyltransferase [Xanthocytophaga flavus]
MAKRKKVSIIFSDDLNAWTGGLYYNINLIQALKTLPDRKKPYIVIFSDEKTYELIISLEYPYITHASSLRFWSGDPKYSFSEKVINKLSFTVLGKALIKKPKQEPKPTTEDLGKLFPLRSDKIYIPFHDNTYTKEHFFLVPADFFSMVPKIYWIPDFQEHYLPQFFSAEDIEIRKKNQNAIAQSGSMVVFSSKDALKDFHSFFPHSKNKTHVINFAVSHEDYSGLNIDVLRQKYNLDTHYFFSPNQFWAHKNHIIVLKAIRVLLEKGLNNFIVAFSGKESDYRNPDYFQSLKDYVKTNGLEKNVRFLGFLDRKEQLKLMQNAIAVVQPSLFEGWSTVVEDAKAMNQYLIASDIDVHKEQLDRNAVFFNPQNENELAEKLIMFLETPPQKQNVDYSKNIRKFAEDLIKIL